jgi:hypothetical protein
MPHTTSNRRAGREGWMIALVVIVIVAIGAGAVMIGVAIDTYRDGKETEGWTATSGQVLSSSIDSETSTVRRNGRTREKTTYSPIVRYAYTVDGVRYEGDHIRADDHGGSYSRASEIAGRYPEERETTVYYDPDHPERAVLVRGAETAQIYLYGGFGVFFVMVGLGLVGLLVLSVRFLNRVPTDAAPAQATTGPVTGHLSPSH